MPREICLTYDGMRRCQRLPELRTPLIPRDTRVYIKGCARVLPADLLGKRRPRTGRPSHGGDAH